MVNTFRIMTAILLGFTFFTGGCVMPGREAIPPQYPGSYSLVPQVDPAVLKAMMKGLDSQDPKEREKAIYDLARISPGGRQAIPKLVDLFNNDESKEIRIAVIRALSILDTELTSYREVLAQALKGDNADVKIEALYLLREAGLSDPLARLVNTQQDLLPVTGLRLPERVPSGLDNDTELIELLKGALEDENIDVRILAARALADLGNNDKDVIPALIEALQNPAYLTWSINVVAKYGPDAADAVPSLLDILKSKHSGPSLKELASIVKPEIDILPVLEEKWPDATLLAMLEKRHPDSVEYKKEPLGGLGLIWNSGWEESMLVMDVLDLPRRNAAVALAEIRPDDDTAQVLEQALNDENPSVCAAVILSLSMIGKGADVAVPRAIELLKASYNPEEYIFDGRNIFEGLKNYGPRAREAVPFLIDRLNSHDDLSLSDIIETLGAIGPAAKDALPDLEKIYMVNRPGMPYAIAIASAIIRIKAPQGKEKAYFAQVLKDESPTMRIGAVRALKDFWPGSFPFLIEAACDENEQVNSYARAVIQELVYYGKDISEATPYLLGALKEGEGRVEEAALDCIDNRGAWSEIDNRWKNDADKFIPALLDIINKADLEKTEVGAGGREYFPGAYLAQRAVQVLRKFSPKPVDMAPALGRLLYSKDMDLVREVVNYFSVVAGPDIAPATGGLADAAINGPDGTRDRAAYALGLIGPGAVDAVPALMEALGDADASVRWNAATALGLIGSGGEEAIEALQKVVDEDANGEVRKAAKEAVGKLRGGDN